MGDPNTAENLWPDVLNYTFLEQGCPRRTSLLLFFLSPSLVGLFLTAESYCTYVRSGQLGSNPSRIHCDHAAAGATRAGDAIAIALTVVVDLFEYHFATDNKFLRRGLQIFDEPVTFV